MHWKPNKKKKALSLKETEMKESNGKNKHGFENATVSPYNSLCWSMSSFTNKLMDFFNWLMWESLNKEWPLYTGEYFSLR